MVAYSSNWQTMIQYTFWAAPEHRDAPEQALKVTRGGCLITDRLFGVILAPYARARVGHMPGDI